MKIITNDINYEIIIKFKMKNPFPHTIYQLKLKKTIRRKRRKISISHNIILPINPKNKTTICDFKQKLCIRLINFSLLLSLRQLVIRKKLDNNRNTARQIVIDQVIKSHYDSLLLKGIRYRKPQPRPYRRSRVKRQQRLELQRHARRDLGSARLHRAVLHRPNLLHTKVINYKLYFAARILLSLLPVSLKTSQPRPKVAPTPTRTSTPSPCPQARSP